MTLTSISDLFDLVASGRIDSVTVSKVSRGSGMIRIAMKRARSRDELWLHPDCVAFALPEEDIVPRAVLAVLDSVSPG